MIHSLERRRALLVAAVVLIGYGYFFHFQPGVGHPHETARISLTLAIVDEGTLAIDGPLRRHGEVRAGAGRDGRRHCEEAPGLSFLAVPFYAVGQALARLFDTDLDLAQAHFVCRWGAVVLPSVIFAYFLYLFLGSLLPPWRLRMLLVLVYALGTPARTYGVLFFGDQTAAVWSAGGVMMLLQFARTPGWRGVASIGLGGLMLGAAFATDYPALVAALVGAGLALVVVRPWWRLSIVALAMAVPGLLCLLYNDQAFGDPLATIRLRFAAPESQAVFGSLLSFERGLFTLSPWLLAALPGLAFLFRSRESRPLAWVSATVLLGFAGCVASAPGWDDGAAGPRHLAPLVPFLLFPIAALMHRLSETSWESGRFLLSALFVHSIVLVNAVSMTFSYFGPDLANPYRDVTLELWRDGVFPDSLGTVFGGSGVTATIPYLAGLAVLALFACVAWPRKHLRRAAIRRTLSFAYAAGFTLLALWALVSIRPEGRDARSAREVRRLLPRPGAAASDDTRQTLVLRGNAAILSDDTAAALRHYRAAQVRP